MHKSRAWAYKWYKRYNDKGLEGLKDKPRSGKPPLVDNDLMIKIRKELEDSNIGWDFRQVMDIIQKRTSIKYHEVHIYRLLHKWGFISKVPQKRFVRTATQEEKNSFKKEYKRP
ncbi:MAG: helix-turn-helix domain-containing protein [Candidatus Nitrosocosmicus sp.]